MVEVTTKVVAAEPYAELTAAAYYALADVTAAEGNVAAGGESQKASEASQAKAAVQRLVDAGGLHGEANREVCVASITLLESIALRNSASHKGMLEAGVATALAKAMKHHARDAEVQTLACQTLQHLATSGTAAVTVATAGACGACAEAMTAHANDAVLQQVGCHLLELVAFSGDASRTIAVADGAVEATVNAFKVQRGNLEVQRAAFATLQALLEHGDECQQRAANAGCVAAIVASLGEHGGDADIQYWAKLLLRGLCAGNMDLQVEVNRKLTYRGIKLDLIE